MWINFFLLLRKEIKKKLFFVFIIMILSIILEVLSIGLIFPIISFFITDNYGYLKIFNFTKSDYFIFQEKNIYLTAITIIFILFFLKNIFLLFFTKVNSNFIAFLTVHYQEKILSNILKKNYSFFAKKNSSYFLREFSSEINIITSGFIQPILDISLNVLTLVGFLVLLSFIDFEFTIISIIIGFFFFLIFVFVLKKKFIFLGDQRRVQNLKIINYIKQIFEGIRELKIYQKENIFLLDLKKSWYRLANLAVYKNILIILPKLTFETFFIFLIVVFFFYIDDPKIIIPKLSIFALVMLRIIPNINMLIKSFQKINYSEVVLNNLVNYFVNEEKKILEIIKFKKKIELKNISFSYNNNKNIFENLNIVISKNSCVGIHGLNGSGKSTLVDLISGLLKKNHGEIFIDEKKYENFSNTDWSSKFGYVQQKLFFFEQSLEFNITLEKNKKKIDYKKLNEIIKKTKLSEILNQRSFTMDDILSESAFNISGGQAQRIGIARALYNSDGFLIFDEAFNNLDDNTIDIMIEIIKELKISHTILIISHIKRPFKICDEIYVLENKKLKIINDLKL
jgi:ABC-type bacteriocin/lantibiotic exporter with double-glycine peptidase domain